MSWYFKEVVVFLNGKICMKRSKINKWLPIV
jgi:hypothetical protein